MALEADLVLEGGGLKGIGLVGAVDALETSGYRFHRVAGTSAGSIVAALLAAGYCGAELADLLLETDLRRFADPSGRVPLVGPAFTFVTQGGLLAGEAFRAWLEEQLAAKGVRTFGDLRERDRGSHLAGDRRFDLVVTVADLTRGELVYLPWDYQRVYGLDPAEQPVADAVRASISIPFVYEPVELRAADGTVSTLVDGGVLSNFPIDVFDRTDEKPPRWPTFGIKIIEPYAGETMRLLPRWLPRARPAELLESVLATMVVGHDQRWLNMPCVRERAVIVDTSAIGTLEFWASRGKKESVLAAGGEAAREFLSTWDEEDHFRRCRGAGPRVT
jgi:NTE family protein